MATTYTSTITIDVWKEHTCVGCGNTYRYRFHRKKSGQGGSPAKAEANAQAAVMKAIAKEVDMQPCPGCGLYQPDMIGSRKSLHHWLLTAGAAVCILVPLIIFAADGMSSVTAAWVTAILCGLFVVGHWLVDFINPNSNLKANRKLAKSRLRDGVLRVPTDVVQGLDRDEGAGAPSWSWAHTLAYLLMFAGLIAFICPELYRAAAGLKSNSDWVPIVAGPGDQPYIYFPDKVSSVKGYWSGSPNIQVLNFQELGLGNPNLPGSSNSDSWGNTITVNNESTTSTKTMWLRVHIPPDPKLEGKELKLQLNLSVNFPQLMGTDKWGPGTTAARPMTKTLVLGSSNCASRYRAIWWGGYLTGTFLVLFASILLCLVSSGMRGRALPTNVFFPEDEGSQPRTAPPPLPKDQRARRPKADDERTYGIEEE
jgi:hypothetical protein